MLNQQSHFIFVAVAEKEVIGFVHLMPRQIIIYRNTAELAALIIDERFRGQGIGKMLLQTVEKTA